MRNYGQVRWLSVVLLLFAITYITYLFERESIAKFTAEVLVGKTYTNEILQKVVLDATSNNDSIILPIKADIGKLQDELQAELATAKALRDSLLCILEDQHNQLYQLRNDLDSIRNYRQSSAMDHDSLYTLYHKLSGNIVKMKLESSIQQEQPKTLLDSMKVLFTDGNSNTQKNRKNR